MALEKFPERSAKGFGRVSGSAAVLALAGLLTPAEVSAQTPPRCPPLLTGDHIARHWYENGQALNTCAGQQRSPADQQAIARLAFVAFYNGLTSATDIASLSADTRNAVEFNLRFIGLRAFGIRQAQSILPLGTTPTTEEVAATNVRIRTNNEIKRANLAVVDGLPLSIVPEGVTVTVSEQPTVLRQATHNRQLGIIALEATDRNLRALTSVLLTTLRALPQKDAICRDLQRNTTGAASAMSRILCQEATVLSYQDYLVIASEITRPNVVSGSVQWPNTLLEGSPARPINTWRMEQIGLNSVNGGVGMARLLQVVGEQFYLLHLYGRMVSNFDTLVVRYGGTAMFSTLRLANPITPDEIARVTGPDAEVSLTQVQVGPTVRTNPVVVTNTTVESPAHIAWRRANEARASRLNMMRIIGISLAGAGAVTAGISFGVNVAERSEAEGIIGTPMWQARVAETNAFIASARAGNLSVAEIEAGNARSARYLREYRAAVESHSGATTASQIAAWTGVGVAIFGGALAILAPIIAGPAPVEPREGTMPAPVGTPATPHPAGRRADTQENGVTVTPNLSFGDRGAQAGVTVSF